MIPDGASEGFQAAMDPGFDYQFRMIVVGDSTVGKSSLLRNFCDGKLCEDNEPTVGVDFYARVVHLPSLHPNPKLKLQLWDTAGQERFRNSAGVLLIYDITRRATFDHIPAWLNEAKAQISPYEAAYLLVGTKMDLDDQREVPFEEARDFAISRDMNFIETSAKSGLNVSQAFLTIARELYELTESGQMGPCNGWDGIKKGNRTTTPTNSSIHSSRERLKSKRWFDSTINLSNACAQSRCCTN